MSTSISFVCNYITCLSLRTRANHPNLLLFRWFWTWQRQILCPSAFYLQISAAAPCSLAGTYHERASAGSTAVRCLSFHCVIGSQMTCFATGKNCINSWLEFKYRLRFLSISRNRTTSPGSVGAWSSSAGLTSAATSISLMLQAPTWVNSAEVSQTGLCVV